MASKSRSALRGSHMLGGGGHNLPQMPTMSSNPRLAVSKTTKEEAEGDMPNLVMDVDSPESLPAEQKPATTQVEEVRSSQLETGTNTKPNRKKSVSAEDKNIHSPAIQEMAVAPQAVGSEQKSAQTHSPTTPIKLRIRNSIKEEKANNPDDSVAEGKPEEDLPPVETALTPRAPPVADPVRHCMSDPGPPRQKARGRPKGSPAKAKKPEKKQSLPSAPSALVTGYPKDEAPKWLVGDMVWVKVSGYPWWPCMVSYDPNLGIYTKFKGPAYRPIREYHVQFFGEVPERAWVAQASTIPFEGREAFEKYAEELIQNASSKNQRKALTEKYKLDIKSKRHGPAWEIGYQSALAALPLSRSERKQQYTFVYDQPKSQKTSKAGAVSADESLDDSFSDFDQKGGKGKINGTLPTNAARKRKLREALAANTVDSNKPIKKRRTLSKSPPGIKSAKHKSVASVITDQPTAHFMVFCQKRHEAVRQQHPDYKDEQVKAVLEEQWAELDEEQKSRFIPMGSDVSHISDMFAKTGRSGRVCKPTKKILEAATDEDYEDFQLPVKKHKRKKSGSQEEPLSSIDEIIQRVAAGDGEVSVPESSDEEIRSLKDPGKKRGRKPKVPTADSASMDFSTSCTIQVPKKRAKQPFVTKDNSDLSEFDDGASRASIDSKDCLADTQSQKLQRTILQENGEEYELEIFRLNNSSNHKKEHVCVLCEQAGEVLVCEGPCGGAYHLNCLGLSQPPAGTFKCDECVTGTHTCFGCKKASADTKKCSIPQCGRFYHEDCVLKHHLTRAEAKGFHCPLHFCVTCAFDDPKHPKVSKGRFYRCVRCPTAFHQGDFCIAAGSIQLAGFNIVCNKHFQPIKTQAHHSHINVSWCFICSQGGTLLCCESCPGAFHADCLKIDPPEGSWTCEDCSQGKNPLYGDIIWVKLGSYRWWPGEICHPRNVPLNIQAMPHQVGEFPVHFLGSHDYFWSHKARVFQFQEGDKGSRDSATTKGLAKVFSRGVKEATMAFKLWQAFKQNREEHENERSDRKPPPYKHVRGNVPIGSVKILKADPSQIPQCECTPDMENPCGPDSECINRLMLYECNSAVCRAGDKCQNQRFQKRQYPGTKVLKTSDRGWGLVTLEDIKKGQFVNEYVGDLIDEEECHRRIKKAHDENVTNFYMLTLDKGRIIDAGPKGNWSRFMNHSCQPNLITQKWTVNGDIRVGLFALTDIPAGSELTFNYNLDALGNEKTKCQCGAPVCSGYLGVRTKTDAAAATEKKVKKKKKKPKMDPRREHEDECYRCGEGGELVMCDRGKCPKAYHLHCLNLTKPPHGKWDCPWHHCDNCGKASVKLCTECPNSYCPAHIEGSIVDLGNGKLVCLENHEDLIEAYRNSSQDPFVPSISSCESETASTESESELSSSVSESSSKANELDVKCRRNSRKSDTSGLSGDERSRPGTPMGADRSKVRKLEAPKPNGSVTSGLPKAAPVTQRRKSPEEPLFDETSEDEGELVIDIPNF